MRKTLTAARCRIALLGYGTVGSALTRRLTTDNERSGITLTHVFDRRAESKRRVTNAPSSVCWTSSIDDILHSDADIVVEAIGGLEPAAEWTRAALLAGKSVVTANKQVVAQHGGELWALAARQGRQLRFEAAVGGAMPIVRAVAEGLAGDRITRIVAILNGTTNAVLSRMDLLGCTLDAAIADARARGYAEADPSLDLEGYDAQSKLAILCALAFGLRIDPARIPARSAAGITTADVAFVRRAGGVLRQIAHAEFDEATRTLVAWVAPIAVPRGSIFARATGPQNAAVITGVHAGDITISGAGAGGDATAVALLGDIAAIARDRAAVVPAPRLTTDFTLQTSDSRIQASELRLENSDFEIAEAV